MATQWRSLLGRINGISTAVFGVSWNPPEYERDIAIDTIRYLEDRRFLFSPFDSEEAGHIVKSVSEARLKLSSMLERSNDDSVVANCVVSMRAAARAFLSRVGTNAGAATALGFGSVLALGELRSSFGFQIALLCRQYEIDVPDSLEPIIPVKEELEDRK